MLQKIANNIFLVVSGCQLLMKVLSVSFRPSFVQINAVLITKDNSCYLLLLIGITTSQTFRSWVCNLWVARVLLWVGQKQLTGALTLSDDVIPFTRPRQGRVMTPYVDASEPKENLHKEWKKNWHPLMLLRRKKNRDGWLTGYGDKTRNHGDIRLWCSGDRRWVVGPIVRFVSNGERQRLEVDGIGSKRWPNIFMITGFFLISTCGCKITYLSFFSLLCHSRLRCVFVSPLDSTWKLLGAFVHSVINQHCCVFRCMFLSVLIHRENIKGHRSGPNTHSSPFTSFFFLSQYVIV